MTFHNKTCLLLLTILLVSLFLFNTESVHAQNAIQFSPQKIFDIPAVNGTIRFSVNGTYTEAILHDNMWLFNNLALNGSRFQGNLTISAKNCNITIHAFRSNSVRYTVEGVGEQMINLGLNKSTTHHSEWSVRNQDSIWFVEGKNWQLLPDNTLIIHNLLGTLTVSHYNYGYPVDDRPLYLQHSVLIMTSIAVLVTVTFASAIKLKNKPRLP